MKLLPFILILTCFKAFSQTEYRIPPKSDSASLESIQFDFNPLEKHISKKEKAELLKELIFLLDTSSCYYFTGYGRYSEFEEQFDNFADSLPLELERNIHAVRLNDDNEYDFIYDRLNYLWDFQSIYSMIKQPDGWSYQKIPGFIVVNIEEEKGKIIGYETFQWACCDFPFDYYYFIEQQNDSAVLKSTTAFSKFSEIPENITIDETKRIEMKFDSLHVYSLKKGNIKEVYFLNQKVDGNFILETKHEGQELVFVRLKVDGKNWGNLDVDYFLGWIKKKDINYVW